MSLSANWLVFIRTTPPAKHR